jgi:hypothetical protein
MNEIWKPIEGYEELYEVSNTGKVRSRDRNTKRGIRRGRELKPAIIHQGYYMVSLCCGGCVKKARVTRLVAEAVCEKREGCDQVNHKDGNKLNNHADNLEWCTKSENMIHAYQNGLQTRVGKGLVRKVVCVTDGKEFASAGDAARFYGITANTVLAQCYRKSKGRERTFRFAEEA